MLELCFSSWICLCWYVFNGFSTIVNHCFSRPIGKHKKEQFSKHREESQFPRKQTNPIGSMYGIFTYIWLIFMVNVGKYTIHRSYGNWTSL